MEANSTVRRKRRPVDSYTSVHNTLVRDPRVSPKAKGVALWLLSHSETFVFTTARISSAMGVGLEQVRTALKELEKYGYLERTPKREEGTARVTGMEYVLDDNPQVGADMRKPDIGEADDGKAALRESTPNKKTNSKEDHLEETLAADAASEGVVTAKKTRTIVNYSDDFEAAWKAYGLKGAKRTAWAEWARAIQRTTVEIIHAAIPPYLAAHPDAKFRKDFERWLKGDVWESAECRMAGFDGAPAMTADEAEAWLLERYHAGAAEEVAARTGRTYEAPHPKSAPPGMDPAEFQLADRKQWIKYYRRGLMCVLMGQPFRNGTEVEGV
jgi:hypothetical protein